MFVWAVPGTGATSFVAGGTKWSGGTWFGSSVAYSLLISKNCLNEQPRTGHLEILVKPKDSGKFKIFLPWLKRRQLQALQPLNKIKSTTSF